MPDFVCPDCGAVIVNNKSARRKRCPRCAYLARKERQKAHQREQRALIKEDAEIRKRGRGRPPKEKPQLPDAVRLRQESDAVLDRAMAELRHKKCRSCRYAMLSSDKRLVVGCDYLGKAGKPRDKSGGPGSCGSYAPRDGTKKQRRTKRCC